MTLAFALALQAGDLDQAWSLLAPVGSGADHERSLYLARRRDCGAPISARGSVCRTRDVDGDTARTDLIRTSPSSGGLFGLGDSSYSNQNTVRLARENGQWRITAPPDPFLLERLP